MTGIGALHPQVVHFVIALLAVGVLARVLSLLPLRERFRFIHPAATPLLLIGATASVIAAKSGTDAHGPVERVPGAREAVVEHEEWGERTRNIFLGVAVIELAMLAFGGRPAARALRVASAVAGLAGGFALYETGEHGGELVYSYAGGVGLRTGDTSDVRRLLVAGLYHQALRDRDAGRRGDAARLVGELALRMPGDTAVRLLSIESQWRDHGEPARALLSLDSIAVPPTERGWSLRVGLLRADLWEAMGRKDSARAVVEGLAKAFPDVARLPERLRQLQ